MSWLTLLGDSLLVLSPFSKFSLFLWETSTCVIEGISGGQAFRKLLFLHLRLSLGDPQFSTSQLLPRALLARGNLSSHCCSFILSWFYLGKKENKDDQVGFYHLSSRSHFYFFISGQNCFLHSACCCDSSTSKSALKAFDHQPHLHLHPTAPHLSLQVPTILIETEHLVVWDVGNISFGCIWSLRDPQRFKYVP